MSTVDATVTVHSLVCHRHVDMALMCLGSLLNFSQEPLNLIVHDDGSLTAEDGEKLQNGLKNTSIIWRSQADEQMESVLRNYPCSRKRRYEHPLRLKLLDIPLFSQTDIAYCDSDILFIKPFSGLFRWTDDKTSALFMTDHQEAFSVQPWQLIGKDSIRLCSRVNSGLMLIRKESYDLDFVEWFLSKDEFWNRPNWGGQTCMSALGYRIGCRLWDPKKIIMIQSQSDFSDEIVAGHFSSAVRHLLEAFSKHGDRPNQDITPAVIGTVPSTRCQPWNLTKMLFAREAKHITYRTQEMLRRSFLGNYKRRLVASLMANSSHIQNKN
jgi:hypothetical protein